MRFLCLLILFAHRSLVSGVAPKSQKSRPSTSISGLTRLLKLPVVQPDSSNGAFKMMQKPKKHKKAFSRISRNDGLVQWVEEISLLRRQHLHQNQEAPLTSSAMFIEMAKTLLYSGSPEQAIELYAAYYDVVVCKVSADVEATQPSCVLMPLVPVVPDAKMVLVAVRAHIALGDVSGALHLLTASHRLGMTFDADSNSALVHDLAESSAEGLSAALEMRSAMVADGQRINSLGVAGLLRGIWMHGLKAIREGSRLLMDPSCEERALSAEHSNSFRLSSSQAEKLAHEVMRDWRAGLKLGEGKSSATRAAVKKIDAAFLRLLFRCGQREGKTPLNHNFESNRRADEEAEAMEGIKRSVLAMSQYQIGWELSITDVLVDECLRAGGLDACKFITIQMNVNSIFARTSTFNSVLRRYAENGDGESAYALLKEMCGSEQTTPDAESYSLLLQSFSRTEKCRFYAREVIQGLCEAGSMSKEIFDRWIELRILSNEPYGDILESMVGSQFQPDAATIALMLGAFRRTGNWEGALGLYKLQSKAEAKRRQYRRDALEVGLAASRSNPNPNPNPNPKEASSSGKRSAREQLEQLDTITRSLPPNYKQTVHLLLELLRDAGKHAEAQAVLADMCQWSEKDPSKAPAALSASTLHPSRPVLPVSLTSSSRFTLAAQYAPDATAFALVMEAVVDSKALPAEQAADQALETFAEMERWGISPNRRIFASLIKAFALRGDIPSALGVFEEGLQSHAPDVAGLQSILDACLARPETLRTLVVTLEKLAGRDDLDLTVFCNDLLLQGFQDARQLGNALVGMERSCEEARRRGLEVVQCSLPVLSVLLQASRKGASAASLHTAMLFLGDAGIAPDADAMEYFRIEAPPAIGAPFSSNYNKKLVPHAMKQRNLLDMDLPEGLADGLGAVAELPDRGPLRSQSAKDAALEPFFEIGAPDIYKEHARILSATILSPESVQEAHDDLEEDDEDTAHLNEDQRLTLVEAAFAWAEEEGKKNDRQLELQPIESPSPLKSIKKKE